MSTEAAWVKKLNKQEPLKEIYSCGMSNPYIGGIPDRYYEGIFRPLWIEFKHIQKETHTFNAATEITPLQRAWLTRCWNNHNKPLVIVGIGLVKGFILSDPSDWGSIWSPARHRKIHMPIPDIAERIKNIVSQIYA